MRLLPGSRRYTIRAIKVGQCEVRDYITFQDSDEERTSTYYLYVWVIEGGPKPILVDTGPKHPEEFSKSTARYIPGGVKQLPEERTPEALRRHGIDPAEVSHVIVTQGPGLWGDITAAIGYDEGGSRITGIEIIDQNETPGLGGRIGEEWFKNQFREKSFPLSTVAEGESAGSREFQAITGATYSSEAIKDIVNSASEKAPSLFGKE